MKVPTEKQHERLRPLVGVGIWLVVGRKGDHGPLIRNGWVEQDPEAKDENPLTWLRLTPDGYRAVAASIEKHGQPSLGDVRRARSEAAA